MKLKLMSTIAITALISIGAQAQGDPVGYIFSPDTPIRANEVNANFQELADRIASLQTQLNESNNKIIRSFHANGISGDLFTLAADKTFYITDITLSSSASCALQLSGSTQGTIVELNNDYAVAGQSQQGGIAQTRSNDARVSYTSGLVVSPGEILRYDMSYCQLDSGKLTISGYEQ